MKEQLEYIFANMNEWLKFAEAKNGAMVALDGALIIGILTVLCGDHPPPLGGRIYGWFAVSSLALSLLLCLLSFCPQTEIRKRRRPPAPDSARDNLYFFGHARKYQPAEYVAALMAAGPPAANAGGGSQPTALETQLAHQIITNADITWWKYWFFKWGLYIAIGAMFTPVVAAIVYFKLDPDRS